MARSGAPARWLVLLLGALLVFQAGFAEPTPALADEPTALPPSTSPAPDPATTPEPTPQPAPGSPVDPPASENTPPGIERADLRSANSRTFETTGGVTTSYGYDDAGNRTSASTSGSTITTTYDRLNRPLTVTVTGDQDATTSYTYSLDSPS